MLYLSVLLLKSQVSVMMTEGVSVVGVVGWPMMVGVVSQPGADAERYNCACLHCTQAGRAW